MGWRDWIPSPFRRRLDEAPRIEAIEARADALLVGPQASNSVANRFSGLGGLGDKGAAARPQGRPDLALAELEILFRQNGYARKAITLVPREVCRAGWRVNDSTDQQDVMRDFDRRVQTRARVRSAWSFARTFGGAVILMVTDEVLTAADLAKPLDPKRIRRVVALQVYDRFEAVAESWENDPTKIGYGRPNLWIITPRMANNAIVVPGEQKPLTFAKVHASRCLYFGGAETTHNQRFRNAGHDDSILESCWESVRNKDQIDASGAFIAQELMVPWLKVADLEAKATGSEADSFTARMRALTRGRSVLNTVLLLEGEEWGRDKASVAGYKELSEAAAETMSSHTGIPVTVLMGRAPSGLNTDGASGRDTFTKLCAAERDEHAHEPLCQLYAVAYASKEGPTKGVVPASWDLEWLPLDEPSASEVATTRKTQAETDAIYVDIGTLSANDIAASRFGAKGWQDEILPVQLLDDEVDEPTDEVEPVPSPNAPAPAK